MSSISKIVLPNNTEYSLKDQNGYLFAFCFTEGNVAQKDLSVQNFNGLEEGMGIRVSFAYENTAANPTLSINGGTAQPITIPLNGNISPWRAFNIITFIWGGEALGWLPETSEIEVIRL